MNKILIALLAAGMTLGAAASAAIAQDTSSTVPDFQTLDTDGNGKLSLQEAQVAWPDLTQEQIAVVDTDGDGQLNTAEYAQLLVNASSSAAM